MDEYDSDRALYIPKEYTFLYRPEPKPNEPTRQFERSFFMLPPGSDVPPRYPNRAPLPTPYDLIVRIVAERRLHRELSTLALVSREWCRAVRKLRFHRLHLEPGLNFPLLLEVFRPDTVLPFVRQIHLNGRLRGDGPQDANHAWLPQLVPLCIEMAGCSPIDYVFLQSLSWGNVPLGMRTALLGLPHVRALGIHDVDFWNSNQFLRALNAYPSLQFLQIWHASFWAYNHVPAQLARRKPLLLTELNLGCAYTPLIMEWLLSRRRDLVIEELMVASRDVYRDDARLARVLKRISPWLKRFHYQEWGAKNDSCEGDNVGDDEDLESRFEREPWAPQRPIRIYDTGEEEEEGMHVDVDVDSDNDGGLDKDGMDQDSVEDDDDDLGQFCMIEVRQPSGMRSGTGKEAEPVRQPRMVKVLDTCLLPDDEEHNCMEDGDSEFKQPPFTRKDSDLGRIAFERELKEISNSEAPLVMPKVESIEGHIYWKSTFSLLTLVMLCRPIYSGEKFYRFDLSISFESVELFDTAPWEDIDRLLLGVTVPRRRGEKELRVAIAVKGWDLRGKKGKEKLKAVQQNLPQTVRKNHLQLYVETWSRVPPPDGPSDWLETY